MTTNLQKFETDLKRLIDEGKDLEYAMIREISPDDFDRQAQEQLGKDAVEKFVKSLPNFKIGYEGWYSETYSLIKQLLPDRVTHFASFYEKPKGRKDISYGNYVIQDFLQDIHVRWAGETKVGPGAALPQFRQQLAILKAAERRFRSSLFEIRQLVQADLFDSEIDAARELIRKKFYRAGGAIAGVVLEKHLHQVCVNHSVKLKKKNPTIADLNEILKANSIIDMAQWRFISMLGDLRNLCSHNKGKEPTVEQANDLIDGTAKVLKTIV